MNTDLIWMTYENVDTNHVAERLFRGRVFQTSVVGIKLRDVTPGTMTIVDILENFPHVRSLTVQRGVSEETLGDLRYSRDIITLQIVSNLLSRIDGVPCNLDCLHVIMTGPVDTDYFAKNIIRLLKKHPRHLTLKIDEQTLLIGGDLYTILGDLNISITFYKT